MRLRSLFATLIGWATLATSVSLAQGWTVSFAEVEKALQPELDALRSTFDKGARDIAEKKGLRVAFAEFQFLGCTPATVERNGKNCGALAAHMRVLAKFEGGTKTGIFTPLTYGAVEILIECRIILTPKVGSDTLEAEFKSDNTRVSDVHQGSEKLGNEAATIAKNAIESAIKEALDGKKFDRLKLLKHELAEMGMLLVTPDGITFGFASTSRVAPYAELRDVWPKHQWPPHRTLHAVRSRVPLEPNSVELFDEPNCKGKSHKFQLPGDKEAVMLPKDWRCEAKSVRFSVRPDAVLRLYGVPPSPSARHRASERAAELALFGVGEIGDLDRMNFNRKAFSYQLEEFPTVRKCAQSYVEIDPGDAKPVRLYLGDMKPGISEPRFLYDLDEKNELRMRAHLHDRARKLKWCFTDDQVVILAQNTTGTGSQMALIGAGELSLEGHRLESRISSLLFTFP